MAKESFYEQMKRLGLWDKPIGELANVIDEKDKAIAEKDKEIERLKETTIDVWIKVPKEDSDGYTN